MTTLHSKMEEECDVVVIGGGLSGLSAANTLVLHDKSLKVILVEASGRLGGRILTESYTSDTGEEVSFDLGFGWVGRSQKNICSLLKELDIKRYPWFNSGTKLMQVNGSKIRSYKSNLPDIGTWFGLLELQYVLYKLEQLTDKIEIMDPYAGPDGPHLDSTTVYSWLQQHARYQAVRDILGAACRANFGVDCSRISMLYLLTVAKSCGGMLRQFVAGEGGAREFRVVGGAAIICERLSEKMKNHVSFRFGEAVVAVEQKEGLDEVHVSTNKGRIVRTKRVISCIPPNQVTTIGWSPGLPAMLQYISAVSPMALIIKFVLVYEKAYWRQEGYSGQVVSSGGVPVGGCDGGPVTTVMDGTNDQGVPALIGTLGGNMAVQWSTKTEAELKQGILNTLEEFFGSWVQKPTKVLLKNWMHEKFVGGWPVCIPGPGTMHAWPACRIPAGRVHFGGTETATVWIGSMEGEVQAGERAALEVH